MTEAQHYHEWYYIQAVWTKTTFLGVPCLKSVSDMWNYQEILSKLRPSVVIEFGTNVGGSALYFAEILKLISERSRIFTVDIDQSRVEERARRNARIEFLESDTRASVVASRIRDLRTQYPGNAFFILDSDHTKDHVFGELVQIRDLSVTGDYVVVEDGNINGHPVLPGWGEGPYEALHSYHSVYPNDYEHDSDRENKFGFTFAPNGSDSKIAPDSESFQWPF